MFNVKIYKNVNLNFKGISIPYGAIINLKLKLIASFVSISIPTFQYLMVRLFFANIYKKINIQNFVKNGIKWYKMV